MTQHESSHQVITTAEPKPFIQHEAFPGVGFAWLGSQGLANDPHSLVLRAAQLSQFTHDVVQPVYTDPSGMDLVRVDPDDPPGTLGDLDWRYEPLKQSGVVQQDGSVQECLFVYKLVESPDDPKVSQISAGLTDQVAMLKMSWNNGVTIDELNVHSDWRGNRGMAPYLLGLMGIIREVRDEDQLRLNVAYGNARAQAFYEKLGFTFTGKLVCGGIFTTMHKEYVARGDDYNQGLDSLLERRGVACWYRGAVSLRHDTR